MRILGIETSGDTASLALVQDGRVVSERLFPARMSLCQTLHGHLQGVLEVATVPEAELDLVAVSLGPGSFTGLRMGVATAKALAHACGLPLVGIPTPAALAWPLCGVQGRTLCVLQHARKTDVYYTRYLCEAGNALEQVRATAVTALEEVVADLGQAEGLVLVVGDGVVEHEETLREALGSRAALAPALCALPRAAAVAAMAGERAADADPQAAMNLRPIYALASQAERVHGVDLGQ